MSRRIRWKVAVALAAAASSLPWSPAEAQRVRVEAHGRTTVDRGRGAVAGGFMLGPGGVPAWVGAGRPDARRGPPRRGVRPVDREFDRARVRYDRDRFEAAERYEREVRKAEDRYWCHGNHRRYRRDQIRAAERYQEAIYKAERNYARDLERARRRTYRR